MCGDSRLVAHAVGDALAALSDALATVRARHGLVETYVFKHSGSSDRLRSDFLEAIENINLQVRVVLVDKSRDWPREFWHFTGNERLASCVAGGAGRLPEELVDGHTLLLDLNQKKDGKFCTMIIKAVHRSTRTGQRHGFRKVKCCPDTHNTHGESCKLPIWWPVPCEKPPQPNLTNFHNCDGSSFPGENKRPVARQHLCCPAPLQGHLRDELKRRTVFCYSDSNRTHRVLPIQIQKSRQARSTWTGITHSAKES